MKKITFQEKNSNQSGSLRFYILCLLTSLSLVLVNAQSFAQQLVAWTNAPSSGWNPTWAPTGSNTNVTVSDFTKGSGIGSSSNPAGGSWGGSGGWSGTPTAPSLNGSLYFTIKADDGYMLSLSSIPMMATRRSGSGPTGAVVMYSIDNGASYNVIASISTSATTGVGTNSAAPLSDLSAIAALQNVPSTTTITIKIVPTGGTNNWYIMATGGGFILNGSVSPAGPLPVTLASFTAGTTDKGVQLDWATATELNSSHFDIERSHDGKSFTTITSISSENNATGARYSFLDAAASGLVYYRLKPVDVDGQYTYSNIIRLKSGNTVNDPAAVSLKANPVKSSLDMAIREKGIELPYQVLDVSGRIMQSGVVSGNDGDARIDVSSIPAGIYLLRVDVKGMPQSLKFLKQ